MNPSNKLLSDIVAFRTYAKYLSVQGRREAIEETINRNMTMHLDKFPKLSKEIVKAYDLVHELKILPSMRGMQFAGQAVVRNNARQYNCSFRQMNDVRSFGEVLFLLLSGVGVGFSVQNCHITQLPKIQLPKEEGYFAVHDSIEGWAQALDVLMEAYFYRRIRPNFDFFQIRDKGSYLVTTGARAPGPEPLKHMLNEVEKRLKGAIGRKLTPLEVHDIVCITSDCVLAGGIRRAALISLFDRNDKEMLKCKTGTWWEAHPYRARANNSAILPREEVTEEEFESIFKVTQASNSGEPGFSWTNNPEMGFNPCLTGDTLVAVVDERKVVSIKQLAEENYTGPVLSIESGEVITAYCSKAWKTKENTQLVAVHLNDGTSIRCTPDHRFMLYDDESYVCAEELKNGTRLMTFNSYIKKVESVEVLAQKEDVYDLTVDGTHNFAIVTSPTSGGIFVHNCHEVSLHSKQFCNLTTINQTGIEGKIDFLNRVKFATIIGTLQAAYTDFPYITSEWNTVTESEALIGVSFTGIADAGGIVTNEWLKEAAQLVLDTNERIAHRIGINKAARTTVLKPEGSSSAVLGSSSGIHSRHSKQTYLRRVRMNKSDALGAYLQTVIPDLVEDEIGSSTGLVITIPQESPSGAIGREDETALQLLNRAIDYNKNWVIPGHRDGDNYNNVSCTVSVKTDEWDGVMKAMWKYRNSYTGISLLPYDGGTYTQAPFETCDRETYEKYSVLVKDVDLKNVKEIEDMTTRNETVACGGGSCEIT